MGKLPGGRQREIVKCIVRQFEAVHEFPGGSRSAGFQVQPRSWESRARAATSLEPGASHPANFLWLQYPNPFLKHYYKAHPEKLPDGHRGTSQRWRLASL